MKVGIFGGTFDPVHFGHLMMAFDIMEIHHLDEVWFCPARLSPHKQDQKPADAHHRKAMLELAIQKVPEFRLIDLELNRQPPSYTIDTLKELIAMGKNRDPQPEFSLILGDDMAQGFFHWHRCSEIVQLVPLLIGRRFCHSEIKELEGNPKICAAIRKGITHTRVVEISSTEIRQRIRQHLPLDHLVPSKVVDYIYQHRVY